MENEYATQLEMIADARRTLADRLVTPSWYHPVLGAMLAAYVVVVALGTTALRLAAVPVFVAGCVLLAKAYQRLTGVWVSGDSAGPARPWAYALGGVAGVLLLGSLAITWLTRLRWPVWLAAVVVFVATIVLGRRFDTALRAHLRGQA